MNVKIGCAEKRVRPLGERGGFARPVCFFSVLFFVFMAAQRNPDGAKIKT